jgi:dihydrofolate reductase
MVHHVLGDEVVERGLVADLLPSEKLVHDVLRIPFAHARSIAPTRRDRRVSRRARRVPRSAAQPRTGGILMGKVIISTHITVDGVIGPSPQDWAILEGEGERTKQDQLLAADAFLLGRKVYETLSKVWPTITDATGFADRVNSMPKYVASRTLREPLDWNASLITGDLVERVTLLKQQHRGNLMSFGCGEFAHELVTRGLADEIHFWVDPAVWGDGERAFQGRQVRMQLASTTTFDSGVALLCYRPAI